MIDLSKLAGQGRSYSAARPWTPEELDALLALERDRGIGRLLAADYIRNGIVTLDAYDKATVAKFAPKTLETAAVEVEAALKDNAFAAPKGVVVADAPKKKGKK